LGKGKEAAPTGRSQWMLRQNRIVAQTIVHRLSQFFMVVVRN
jgi:hypothetical protein